MPVSSRVSAAYPRAAITETTVAFLQCGFQAFFLRGLAECERAGGEVTTCIVLGCEPLQRAPAHQFDAQIDNAFVRGQQVGSICAIRLASPSTSASSTLAGTDFKTSPITAASSPVTVSPVNSSRFAHCGPQ